MDVFQKTSTELAAQLPGIVEQTGKSPREIFKEYLQFHFEMAAANPIIRLILKSEEMASLSVKSP